MISTPCEVCPVGDARCRGLLHHRDCEHVRAGVSGYAALLRSLAVTPPLTDAEARARRRAGKPHGSLSDAIASRATQSDSTGSGRQ